MLKFLSSLKLTLALLLGLSGLAVIGTVRPLAEGRYELFYQSLWFRFGLALLAVNLAACTLKTLRRNLRDREQLFELLHGEQVFAVSPRYVLSAKLEIQALQRGLTDSGYRVARQGDALLARRGLPGRWGSTLVHLAVLIIMCGALAGEMGFVGTLNLHVGDKSATYYDWSKDDDRPLGFEFRLDRFAPVYYPIELQFAAFEPATRREIRRYTVKEGDTVELPPPGGSARVEHFDPLTEDLLLTINRDGRELGEYHAMGGKHRFNNVLDLGFELRPLAYRDPVLKQLHSEVSILERGQVVHQGAIEINHPLSYRGVKIYQTAYNRDKFGFWSAGFQVTRDPAEPLVWFGSILLIGGLLVAFFNPYRAVGITRYGDETLLVGLAGFRGQAGEELLDALEKHLVDREPSQAD